MRTLFGILTVFGVASLAAADEFKPEPGFASLFNGKDLTGWKVDWSKQKKEKKSNEPLDGKTEAVGGRFKVADGMIVIDPKVKGDIYIETAKSFAKDVTILFEYNPALKCNNDLLIRGIKFDIKDAKAYPESEVKNIKIGEWNKFEIIVKGTEVEFKNNGESMVKYPTKGGATPFTLRAEVGGIQYRKLQVKE